MRRRWHWPILRRLACAEPEVWFGAWCVWLIVGFIFLIAPAMAVDHNRHGDAVMGSFLLIALIIYATPLLVGVLAMAVLLVRFVIDEYGRELLPRRVTESVEDIRRHYRDENRRQHEDP